jgi:membrane fusion protein (multidrug efflux system)
MLALLIVAGMGCYNRVEGKASDRADASRTDAAKEAAKAKSSGMDRVLIPVQVVFPVRMNVSSYFETTARVMAERRVEIMSKGIGICREVKVEEGDTVKAGQVLAQLDKQELETQILQTKVNLESRKAALEIAERSLQEGIGSKVERDNARFANETASAMLQSQELQLQNQTIVAPIDGVITRRVVQMGQMVATGAPVFSIVDPTSYILPINPPEKELDRLRVGQEAKVSIDSYPGKDFVAHVRRINPSVDPLSGTVKVTLDFETADRALMRDSAFARVRLVMETHENVLVVPKDAILEENARTYLMTVREQTQEEANKAAELASKEQTAEGEQPAAPTGEKVDAKPCMVADRVEVKTGFEDKTNIEIQSDIDEKTSVVTLGQHTLKRGSLVVATTADRELSNQAAGASKPGSGDSEPSSHQEQNDHPL